MVNERKSRVPIPDDLPPTTRLAINLARLGDAFRDDPRFRLRNDETVRNEREWRDRDIIAMAYTGKPAVRRRHDVEHDDCSAP